MKTPGLKIMGCLLVAIFMAAQTCLAQTGRPSLEKFIDDCVTQGASSGTGFHDIQANSPFIFAIAVSFDKKGAIDTLYFSEKLSKVAKEKYRLDGSLLTRIKSYKLTFPKYSSQIVLSLFFYRNYKDKVADYKSGVLEDLANLAARGRHGQADSCAKAICEPV